MMTQLASVAIKASVRVSTGDRAAEVGESLEQEVGVVGKRLLELVEHVFGDLGLEIGAKNELGARAPRRRQRHRRHP